MTRKARRVSNSPDTNQWKTLDKDLGRISQVEYATAYVARPLTALGIALPSSWSRA